jgi:hypothetical protein
LLLFMLRPGRPRSLLHGSGCNTPTGAAGEGLPAIVRATALGAVVCGLNVTSGSLSLPIVSDILIDLLQGETVGTYLRDRSARSVGASQCRLPARTPTGSGSAPIVRAAAA